jgi:anti-anti-sigma factor
VLSTQVRGSRDRTVLALRGDLDVSSGPSLQAAVGTLLGRAGTLELQLGRLRFVDSFGYGVLIRCIRLARAAGIRVEVTSLQGTALALGERYGLARLLAS